MAKAYLCPVDGFDLNLVLGTSWGKSPAPCVCSLTIGLFLFHSYWDSIPAIKIIIINIIRTSILEESKSLAGCFLWYSIRLSKQFFWLSWQSDHIFWCVVLRGVRKCWLAAAFFIPEALASFFVKWPSHKRWWSHSRVEIISIFAAHTTTMILLLLHLEHHHLWYCCVQASKKKERAE